MRRIPGRTLGGTLLLFAAFAGVLPVAVSLPGFLAASRAAGDERAVAALTAAAGQISARLGAGIGEQWDALRVVARWAAADTSGNSLPLRFDAAQDLLGHMAWMGIAAPDGRVVLGTQRTLEGQDVSARPWFRAGLQGDYVGDVREPTLLRRHLAPPADGEPVRLIDFAMPLRRADGTLIGVASIHLDWAWLRDRVRRAGLPAGLEAMLVARDGTVIVGPQGLEGSRLTQRATLVGGQGLGAVTREEWPDGQRYLAVSVPAGSAEGMPGFGWTVTVRQPSLVVLGEARSLAGRIGIPLLGCAVLILLLGAVLARAVARPFTRLATAATELAEARLHAPVPDTRSTREAALISAALARLDHAAPGSMAAGDGA